MKPRAPCLVVGLLSCLMGAAALQAATPRPERADGRLYERRDQAWRIDSYAEDAGLARQNIWTFDFDRDGSLWVAASGGLLHYDGYTWRRYGVEDGLPSHFVRAVRVTRAGALWVGTDKGAGIFRPESDGSAGRPNPGAGTEPGKRAYEPMGSEKGLAGPSVRRIVEDPDGTLWFCSDRWPDSRARSGLTSYRAGVWRAYGVADGLPSDHLYNYFRDSEGRQFAMTKAGVRQRQGERWVRPPGNSGIADAIVWGMAEAPDTGVVARAEDGFYVLRNGRWSKVADTSSRHEGMCPPLCSTTKGEILTCDFDGRRFGVFRWTGGDIKAASPRIEDQDHSTEYIQEAPDGSVWFCAYGVFMRWRPFGGEWTEYDNLPFPRVVDGKGRIWFADKTGATVRDHGQWRAVPEMAGMVSLDDRGEVWAWKPGQPMLAREDGELRRFGPKETGLAAVFGHTLGARGWSWFNGLDAGGHLAASVFDGTRWITLRLGEIEGARIVDSSPDSALGVWYLAVLPDERHVACLHAEIGAGRRAVPALYTTEYGGIAYSQPHLTADRRGRLWLSGQDGVYALDPAAGGGWTRISGLAGNDVGKGVARGDEIWFPYTGWTGGESGFARWQQGRWTRFAADFSDLFEVGAQGTLWVGIVEGLERVADGPDETPAQLTLPAGQRVHTLVEAGGEIWMGVVRPDGTDPSVLRYRPDHVPPRTILETVAAGARQDRRLAVTARGQERFVPKSRKLAYRFSWKFDDGPWGAFQPIPSRGIAVEGLRPGTHRLLLRAQDEGLDVDPAPVEASFAVAPTPLQERVWFKPALGAVLAVIAALAAVAWERALRLAKVNRQLAASRELLEERVAERTAELSASNRELKTTQGRLLEASRLAGMAEVANGVLHNVGNVLNSVNVSAGIIRERVQGSRLGALPKLASLLKENSQDLGRFLTEDPRGRKVPEYVEALAEAAEAERREAVAELDNLRKNVDHIKGIVSMQQGYGRVSGIVEREDIAELVEDAIRMNALGLEQHRIELERDFRARPVATVDRHRTLQILVNLVRNAQQACEAGPAEVKRVAVRIVPLEGRVRIEVEDNGVGIEPANLTRIFSHGFTTKKNGHGFGLHSGALAAKELGGTLTVRSEGPGKGAVFALELPLSPPAA